MAFFSGAQNVDTRGSTFNVINGNQVNHIKQDRRAIPRGLRTETLPPRSIRRQEAYWMDHPQGGHNPQILGGPWSPRYEYPIPMPSSERPSPLYTPDWILPEDTQAIHSSELLSLDRELVEFETNISPWRDPLNWIRTNTDRIAAISQKIATLTKIEGVQLLSQYMIYPRLALYIFVHLSLCAKNESLLDDFRNTLKTWYTWDLLTMLQNHQSIRDELDRFRQSMNIQPDLHPKMLLQKLLALDAAHFAAHLAVAVTDDNKYNILIDQKGPGAQALINLLQARLDFFVAPDLKKRHVKALIKLCRGSRLCPECFVLKDVEMHFDAVAGGGFGDVYRGTFKGEQIAVKVLKIGKDNDRLLKEFASEAVIWRQLEHPNILPFCGVYHLDDATPRLCLVSPWLQDGNLVDFLKRHGNTDCVQLALDIASGLEYLHGLTLPIVHGDLKAFNVLVTPSHRACLADFGLSAARDTQIVTVNPTGSSGGTTRWQAPELFGSPSESTRSCESHLKRSSIQSDIYAFACVCYEMFSGMLPWQEIRHEYIFVTCVLDGKRPARPSYELSSQRGLTNRVWNIVEACWAQDPRDRPSATKVVEEFRLLPDRPEDKRRPYDIPILIPSQEVYKETCHPFSALKPNDMDDPEMKELKWMSRR